MICYGCYKAVKEGYCPACRKTLFDKLKVPAVLGYDAPGAGNISSFQEHTRQLSISGVQLKYSLRLDGRSLALCEKNSEYILKPVPPNRQLLHITEVPENEHLTMQIAAQVYGIQTAANALIKFKDGEAAYITRRFDVRKEGGKYLQEDFAQLTKRTKATHGASFKYDGTYEEIGGLIRKYVAAAPPGLEKFFQLIVFNYVISNGDAHLKNFSLIRHDNGEYQLTPAYDLISTVIHTPYESDTALDLYRHDVDSDFYSAHGYYGRDNFMELAGRLGIVAARAGRIIDQFSVKQQQVESLVRQSFLSDEVKEKYMRNFSEKLQRIT